MNASLLKRFISIFTFISVEQLRYSDGDALTSFHQQDDDVAALEFGLLGLNTPASLYTDQGLRIDMSAVGPPGTANYPVTLMTCKEAEEFWFDLGEKKPCLVSDGKKWFSSVNGSCNNPHQPNIGKSKRPFIRLLKPRYCDGVELPRCAYNRSSLPNARSISSAVQNVKQAMSSNLHSAFLMQWGQYISHDLSFTPLSTANDGSNKKLECNCTDSVYQSCFNIMIPEDDMRLENDNACMPVSRSLASIPDGCGIRSAYREQLNQVTPFVDAGTVYGSSYKLFLKLREPRTSKMKVKVNMESQKHLLPDSVMVQNLSSKFRCPEGSTTPDKCFAAGDTRVNETPTLTISHLLWVREHNRIANSLEQLNPDWSVDRVFKETRQIIIALHQHITYAEYLPEVLGPTIARSIYDGRSRSGYDYEVDPRISNVFATAAFRFGHSQITDQFAMGARPISMSSSPQSEPQRPVDLEFFNPSPLYNDDVGDYRLADCLLASSGSPVNCNFANVVRNKLFVRNNTMAFDLLALNIQRGRDHGIPDYARWSEWCGNREIQSWEDLRFHPEDEKENGKIVEILRSKYSNVSDIDLYVGGLLEEHIPEGIVGHTFACILTDQFMRLKSGDRFWFDNAAPYDVFTQEQIEQIRKVTLAKVICNNIPEMHRRKIQSRVMRLPNVGENREIDCDMLPDLDLTHWREKAPKAHFSGKFPRGRAGIPRYVARGGRPRLSHAPSITFWLDEAFTRRAATVSSVGLGETVFVDVSYSARQSSVLYWSHGVTGLKVKTCSLHSARSSPTGTERQVADVIRNGCPNTELAIPISILPTTSSYKFRFRFQNFRLTSQQATLHCTIILCGRAHPNCAPKVCANH